MERHNWMSNFQYKSILDLVIPGSHDSFAYNMMITGPNTNNMPKLFNLFINFWSKTQNKTIHEQLMMGIRYFDLRITKYNGNFHTIHSLISISLEDVLIPIIEFVKRYPTEKLILDFNHLYLEDRNEFKEYIMKRLNGLMIINSYANRTKMLNQLDGSIFVFMSGVSNDYIALSDEISSYWHDTNKIIQLVQDIKNEPISNDLSVCQGILTPIQSDVILGIILFLFFPVSLQEMTDNNKNLIYTAIGESISNKNIVIVDYVDEDFVDICLTENYNRLLNV